MFTAYPYETKRLVNKVNVVRKYFGGRARELPNAAAEQSHRVKQS
jgi:hypothetical protein